MKALIAVAAGLVQRSLNRAAGRFATSHLSAYATSASARYSETFYETFYSPSVDVSIRNKYIPCSHPLYVHMTTTCCWTPSAEEISPTSYSLLLSESLLTTKRPRFRGQLSFTSRLGCLVFLLYGWTLLGADARKGLLVTRLLWLSNLAQPSTDGKRLMNPVQGYLLYLHIRQQAHRNKDEAGCFVLIPILLALDMRPSSIVVITFYKVQQRLPLRYPSREFLNNPKRIKLASPISY